MLGLTKMSSVWIFPLLLIISLIACTQKNNAAFVVIEFEQEMSEESIAKLFQPHELLSISKSSRSKNQYTCKVEVKQKQQSALILKLKETNGVLAAEMMKMEPDAPKNSTNDKRVKTKPIKS